MKILKRNILIVSFTITILSLFSCNVYNAKKDKSKQKETVYETTAAMSYGSSNGFAKSSAKMASADVASEEMMLETGYGDRKIAKSVSLNAETKTFDSSIEWIKKYVASFNGIIDSSFVDTGDVNATNYKKNAHFLVRIPAEKLDSFLGQIGNNLNIIFKQENIVDVTDDYFDSESKLKSLKIEEENLNGMLKIAKSVDEMIKVEDKLSEVRANIESINRRIKSYDKQINYSRVDISISEVRDLTDTKTNKYDFSKESLNKKLFKTYEDVILFLKQVAAYIFINIPWIVLALIVILIEVLLYSIIKSFFVKKNNDKNDDKDLDLSHITDEDKNKSKNKIKKEHNNENDESTNEDTLDKVLEEISNVVMSEDIDNNEK